MFHRRNHDHDNRPHCSSAITREAPKGVNHEVSPLSGCDFHNLVIASWAILREMKQDFYGNETLNSGSGIQPVSSRKNIPFSTLFVVLATEECFKHQLLVPKSLGEMHQLIGFRDTWNNSYIRSPQSLIKTFVARTTNVTRETSFIILRISTNDD